MHLWRYPSSIHGLRVRLRSLEPKQSFSGRVIGKFSIRLVPHMDMSVVEAQVTACLVLHCCPSAAHHTVGGSSVVSTEVDQLFPNRKGTGNVKKLMEILVW